jgi:TPR repeat protein
MYSKGRGVNIDYKKEFEWLTKSAVKGYAKAQFNLALLYANGQGVTQDYKLAVKWYTKAAEQGYANAQNNLGLMYYKGEGVPQDYKLAVKLYTKAAEQGFALAQNNLGFLYDKGQGVTQDYKEAVEWYTKAANQGNELAKNNLKELQKKIRDNLTKIETQLNDKKKVITQLKTTGFFMDSSKGKYLVFKDDSDQKNYLLFSIEKVGDLKGKRVRINANIKPTKDGRAMFIPHIKSIELVKE